MADNYLDYQQAMNGVKLTKTARRLLKKDIIHLFRKLAADEKLNLEAEKLSSEMAMNIKKLKTDGE